MMASFAFFASSTKITANVCLFIPSLGLFDILHHWQAEQIQFSVSKSGKLNSTNGDLLYLFNKTPVTWASIDRWDYPGGSPPNYDIYTGTSIAQTFLIFLLLNVIQYATIFIAKLFTSPSFRKANKVKSIVNSMETSHVPLPFEDWDMAGGTIQEHKQRRTQVVREVLSVIAVNKIIGLIMFAPLIYMVININQRHTILSQSIGTRPEENHSYEQAQFLIQATISFFLLGTVLEIVSYLVFNFKLHPWKDMMMEEDDSNSEKKIHILMMDADQNIIEPVRDMELVAVGRTNAQKTHMEDTPDISNDS